MKLLSLGQWWKKLIYVRLFFEADERIYVNSDTTWNTSGLTKGEMCTLSEKMFSIGGNMHLSAYRDTKYEPLGLILEVQEEVKTLFSNFFYIIFNDSFSF